MPFSKRQVQVLNLLANGMAQKEIANALNLNYNTFRRQLMYMRAEVLAHTNEQLVAISVRNGWIK